MARRLATVRRLVWVIKVSTRSVVLWRCSTAISSRSSRRAYTSLVTPSVARVGVVMEVLSRWNEGEDGTEAVTSAVVRVRECGLGFEVNEAM